MSTLQGKSTHNEPEENPDETQNQNMMKGLTYHFNSTSSACIRRDISEGKYERLRSIPVQVIHASGQISVASNHLSTENEPDRQDSIIPDGAFMVVSGPDLDPTSTLLLQIRSKIILLLVLADFIIGCYLVKSCTSSGSTYFWTSQTNTNTIVALDFILLSIAHTACYYGLKRSRIEILTYYGLCLVTYLGLSIMFAQASVRIIRMAVHVLILYQIMIYRKKLMFSWYSNSVH